MPPGKVGGEARVFGKDQRVIVKVRGFSVGEGDAVEADAAPGQPAG